MSVEDELYTSYLVYKELQDFYAKNELNNFPKLNKLEVLKHWSRFNKFYCPNLVVFLNEKFKIVKWFGDINKITDLCKYFDFYETDVSIEVGYEWVDKWKSRGFIVQKTKANVDKVVMVYTPKENELCPF